MFTQQNNIIIVDDNEDHLKSLSKEFHDNGIGCRAFLYESFYNVPLKGIKVAFFDININPSGGHSEKQIFAALAEALKQYIHLDNGPFALVFWTSNVNLIDDFKTYIEKRHKDQIPVPFIIRSIDKHQFLDNPGGQNIGNKLSEILNEPTIKLLFNFELKLIQAATLTIKQVYDIIPRTDRWGDNTNFSKDMDEVFSKIAISTLGFEHAKKNPDKAIADALSQMLLHQISQTKLDDSWKKFLISLQTVAKSKDIQNSLKFQSKLNTIFHVETALSNKDARGVVLQISKNKQGFIKRFSKSYNEWVSSFVPLKTDFKEKDKLIGLKALNTALTSSKLIAIEISSACDYSQNKNRLNKYLYGILIQKLQNTLVDRSKSYDYSLHLGSFMIDDKEYDVFINLNYSFSCLPSDNHLGKPLFQFKKEMMDFVGNRYANHASRIGITSFVH